jgi:gliding motility-associated-like protein
LCVGDSYQFGNQLISSSGDYVETFQSREGCDSIVYLEVKTLESVYDTLFVKKFSDEDYEIAGNSFSEAGIYDIETTDERGCTYFIQLDLEDYKVYWPNIFSPNDDGNNDYFQISGGPELSQVKELIIYNRWGSKVFHQEDFNEASIMQWDGKSNRSESIGGVYVFQATLLMQSGQEKTVFGSITLIR